MPSCQQWSFRLSQRLKSRTQKAENVTAGPWKPHGSAYAPTFWWLPRQTTAAAARPEQEDALLGRSSKPQPWAELCQITAGRGRPCRAVVQRLYPVDICQQQSTNSHDVCLLHFWTNFHFIYSGNTVRLNEYECNLNLQAHYAAWQPCATPISAAYTSVIVWVAL